MIARVPISRTGHASTRLLFDTVGDLGPASLMLDAAERFEARPLLSP